MLLDTILNLNKETPHLLAKNGRDYLSPILLTTVNFGEQIIQLAGSNSFDKQK